MRLMIFVLLMIFSLSANAATYHVMQLNNTSRIVLAEEGPCLVDGKKGKPAAVQRTDGSYVKGCWYEVDNNKHYRIDWDNQFKKDDFSVLIKEWFTKIEE